MERWLLLKFSNTRYLYGRNAWQRLSPIEKAAIKRVRTRSEGLSPQWRVISVTVHFILDLSSTLCTYLPLST